MNFHNNCRHQKRVPAKMKYKWLLLVFPGCHLNLFQGDWFENTWKYGWTATFFFSAAVNYSQCDIKCEIYMI